MSNNTSNLLGIEFNIKIVAREIDVDHIMNEVAKLNDIETKYGRFHDAYFLLQEIEGLIRDYLAGTVEEDTGIDVSKKILVDGEIPESYYTKRCVHEWSPILCDSEKEKSNNAER